MSGSAPLHAHLTPLLLVSSFHLMGLKPSLPILFLESQDSNHLIQDTRAIFPSLHFAFVFSCGTKNVRFILNALIARPLF